MSTDPIIDELHRQRAEEMKRFDYDFDAYCRHLREQQANASAPVVPAPRVSPKPETTRGRRLRR